MRLLEWAPLVVFFNQCGGVHLGGRFPCVVCVWVSFPFEEILQDLPLPVETVINDGLDFVLVFALDQFVISSASGMARGEVFDGPTDWLGSRDPMTPIRYTHGSPTGLDD
jgi:hypothetical protein